MLRSKCNHTELASTGRIPDAQGDVKLRGLTPRDRGRKRFVSLADVISLDAKCCLRIFMSTFFDWAAWAAELCTIAQCLCFWFLKSVCEKQSSLRFQSVTPKGILKEELDRKRPGNSLMNEQVGCTSNTFLRFTAVHAVGVNVSRFNRALSRRNSTTRRRNSHNRTQWAVHAVLGSG